MNHKHPYLSWLFLGILVSGPVLADTAPPPGVRHLTLQEALRVAVANSPDLAQYRSKIRQAEWQVQEARSAGRPQAEFDASYTQLEPPVIFSFGGTAIAVVNEQNYKFGPTLRQAVATFGRLHYRVLAAQLSELATRNDYRRVVDALLEQVATQYDQVLEAEQNVTIAEANVATREDHLSDTRKMFGAGTVAKFDVIRNQSDVDLARQQLLQSQNQYSHALVALLSALGLDPTQPVVLGAAGAPSPPPSDRAAGVAAALQHRPELATLLASFQAMKANADYARSQLNPSINFQASYVDENDTGFNTPNQFAGTLSLTMPIFDGGLSKSQRNEALEQAEQLRQQYESARRSVVQDVATAWDDLQSSWQRLELANKTVDETVELTHVAEVRYQGGIGTNLERLDAENNLVQVRSTAATALYDYLQAQVRWTRATGQDYPSEVLAGFAEPPRQVNAAAPQPPHDDKGVPGLINPGASAEGAAAPPPPPVPAPTPTGAHHPGS